MDVTPDVWKILGGLLVMLLLFPWGIVFLGRYLTWVDQIIERWWR